MKTPFNKFIRKELGNDFLLISCGLPATGKTWASEEIAGITGYPLLRTDVLRRDVLKNEDIFNEKTASSMNKRLQVYEAMFRSAEKELQKSWGILLDATFITQVLRRRAAEIANRHKLRFIILETVCPQEDAIRRILARTREDYRSNALTEQAYLDNKARFEKVDIADLKKSFPTLNIMHIVVDTTQNKPEKWYIIEVERR